MYLLLILFFASLFGITLMIGRKLVLLQNGQIFIKEENLFQASYFEGWKKVILQSLKLIAHRSLVETIRFYFRASNFLKNKYQEIKIKIKNRNNEGQIESEKQEISKFLKIISEYKHKIKQIKQKIKEEENL